MASGSHTKHRLIHPGKRVKLACFGRGLVERMIVPRHDTKLRMTIRSLILIAFVISLAFANGSPGPALAQETGGQTAGQTAPALDQAAARIKYLHDRLRITAEQEPLWNAVAQAIQDNAGDLAPLFRERF